jgi:hypothetical protein
MYDVSIQGLLFCWGPLIVTVLGFAAFAWWTDGDARRSYLRRIDLRDEWEAPEVPEPVMDKPFEAKTPSNARVQVDPTQRNGGVNSNA